MCAPPSDLNLVEGCENGAGNRRKYDTRKHLEDACTGVNSPKTSKRMQVDVILPWKVRSLYESLKLWIKGKVRWLFGLICLSEKELPNRLKDTLYPRGWYCRELRCDTNIKHWWMMEKPRDFDPFGQTGFAHLWLQYDWPFKVLVLGVNFILPF